MAKRLLISLVVIALSVAAISASTFAYFADTETSAGNSFTAGSLDLQVYGASGWVNGATVPSINAAFDDRVSKLKPGDQDVLTIPVMNSGTLPGTPSLTVQRLVETAGARSEPEGDAGADLGAAIDLVVKYDGVVAGSGTLRTLAGHKLTAPAGALPAGGIAEDWTIEMSIASDIGNEIMGDVATCDVEFGLDQQ